MRPRQPAWAREGKEALLRWLLALGIKDDFRVTVWKRMPRVPAVAGVDYVGSYVRFSQWSIRGTELRLSAHLPEYVRALLVERKVAFLTALLDGYTRDAAKETLAHEYGHVVWEFIGRTGSPHPSVAAARAMLAHLGPEDEEDFAEGFVVAIRTYPDPWLLKLLRLYGEILRSERGP